MQEDKDARFQQHVTEYTDDGNDELLPISEDSYFWPVSQLDVLYLRPRNIDFLAITLTLSVLDTTTHSLQGRSMASSVASSQTGLSGTSS